MRYMDAKTYIVLIEVHLRNATFSKGQRITLRDMGVNAFVLLHYGLALLEQACPATPELAA